MKQLSRLLLLTAFVMTSGLVSTVSYAYEEAKCGGKGCYAEEVEEEEEECD